MPPDTGPWQPQPCDKALTVALAPNLALETRSAARARFDAEQMEKALQAQVLLAGFGCGSALVARCTQAIPGLLDSQS